MSLRDPVAKLLYNTFVTLFCLTMFGLGLKPIPPGDAFGWFLYCVVVVSSLSILWLGVERRPQSLMIFTVVYLALTFNVSHRDDLGGWFGALVISLASIVMLRGAAFGMVLASNVPWATQVGMRLPQCLGLTPFTLSKSK